MLDKCEKDLISEERKGVVAGCPQQPNCMACDEIAKDTLEHYSSVWSWAKQALDVYRRERDARRGA